MTKSSNKLKILVTYKVIKSSLSTVCMVKIMHYLTCIVSMVFLWNHLDCFKSLKKKAAIIIFLVNVSFEHNTELICSHQFCCGLGIHKITDGKRGHVIINIYFQKS